MRQLEEHYFIINVDEVDQIHVLVDTFCTDPLTHGKSDLSLFIVFKYPHRVLNKTQSCLKRILNKVTMYERFVTLICINRTDIPNTKAGPKGFVC